MLHEYAIMKKSSSLSEGNQIFEYKRLTLCTRKLLDGLKKPTLSDVPCGSSELLQPVTHPESIFRAK